MNSTGGAGAEGGSAAVIGPRPEVLADPAARVDGMIIDSLAYIDTEVRTPGRPCGVRGVHGVE
jgi:hypothetical protein